ncbi:hypothetical protein PLESTB_001057500 [Pleodorina starrii]|uniref:Crossover junction endonuclease MUS81-like HHH domain-containing protein n=1 Tax=Pleodorina starrii TaxID=330485 RepID=A0A9W6BQC1_9CHLO|nr:hypothetical protein PLESTB_001057500 [Pleodorina starrii]
MLGQFVSLARSFQFGHRRFTPFPALLPAFRPLCARARAMSGRPKRAPKRSRKYSDEDEPELEEEEVSDEVPLDDESEEEEEKPKKKARAPPKPKTTPKPKVKATPVASSSGWQIEKPSLLFKYYGDPKPNTKIAGVDLDGTMVNTKSGAQFPKDAADWKWFNKATPDVIRSYHDRGFKVVIFTNQGGIKSAVTGKMAEKVKGRIDAVVGELGIPCQVFAATMDDQYRKPEGGMWEFFTQNANGGVQPDLSNSFFVGDAAGRPGDFAESDKGFAAAVGIRFRLPEDEFGDMEGKRALPPGVMAKNKGEDGKPVAVNPDNAGLVSMFSQVAEKAFEEAKVEAKMKFKAINCKKVAAVLADYPAKITLANLKDVGKLQGVGKGSIAKIKEFLETGTVSELSGVDDLAGVGKAAPQLNDAGKDMANKFM